MSDIEFPTPNPRLDLSRPDPQNRNATAADRLFDAVTCLLVERGTELLGDSLKPDDVTARAGKARASYYRTTDFPGSDPLNSQVRTDVLERLIARVLQASAGDLTQVVGGIASYIDNGWMTDSPREFIRETTANNFDQMFDSTSMVQMLAAALSPSSPSIANELGAYYEQVTQAYTASYEQVFAFWKYRTRPPLTLQQFTVVVMALAEGLMMRSFADPEIDRETFSELLEIVGGALMVSMGEVAHDGVPPEHDLPGSIPPPTRASLIATLLRLFESDRATMPTVDELARAAGCSPLTITATFGGVVGLLRAAWDEWMPQFEEEAARSAAQGSDPITTLYRVALSIAVRAAEQQALTRALVMSEIGVDPHSTSQRTDPIAELFGRLVQQASELGDLRPPAANLPHLPVDDATVFAHALRSTLLSIVINTPLRGNRSPEEHGRWCVDYAFAALLPARRTAQRP